MKNSIQTEPTQKAPRIGGLAQWLLARLSSRSRPQPVLVLRERITLGPRQMLSLVEADGRRLLIATSPEGAPAFFALDEAPRSTRASQTAKNFARVSW